MRLANALFLLTFLAGAAHAAAPVRLAPSANWSLNYGASCQLSRTFGEGDRKSTLVIERVAPDQMMMTMLVVGKPFDGPSVANDYRAQFLPLEKVRAENGAAARSTDGSNLPAILWARLTFGKLLDMEDLTPEQRRALDSVRKSQGRVDLQSTGLFGSPDEDAANAAAVTSVEITRKNDMDVILETGSLGGVYKMLEQCANDQLTSWGIDPALEKKIVRRPWARAPQNWFTSDDFPADSFRRSDNSNLSVRLLIDAAGRITKCTPITFVSDQSYMQKVCDVMEKRGRFEPAELADGTKVPSYYIQRISFAM